MIKFFYVCVISLISSVFVPAIVSAQEFPVAVGSDTTFSDGAVYGGENGLVAVCGDASSQYSITAQLVGANGTSGYLIGPRISLGAYGIPPGAAPIFDGTNYFLVWRDFGSNLQGQFINTSGNLVGTTFAIASNVALDQKHTQQVVYGDSTILVAYVKNDGYLYARRLSKEGSLLGTEIQIVSSPARDFSVSFDGTNYLLVWVDDVNEKNISGQFVSEDGSLVGSNFLIDGGPNYSDNPTSLAFDGARYLLAYHESPGTSSPWTLMARFIRPSGAVEDTFTICGPSAQPAFPSVAFDNVSYFITWVQSSNNSQMGRFYNTSGIPIDTAFVVFGSLGNKIPVGGIGFGGGLYLAVVTRVDSSFSDGDVYGRFIMPLVTGVTDRSNGTAGTFTLFQNYPNPSNPSTTINYELATNSLVALKVFDVVGREILTLVNEHQTAGSHSVRFNGANLPSGVYFYTLHAGMYHDTKKLLLLK